VHRFLFYTGLCALSLGVLIAPSTGLTKDVTALVLYFDNNTGQKKYDVLQKGLADMMITDLAAVDGLRVVEREKMDALLSELKLQRSRFFDKETALKMGKGLGATHAVTGAFVAFAPKMRIDIRLVDVATGEVVLSDKVIGSKDQILDLQQTLLKRFVAGLNRTFQQTSETVNELDLATVLAYSKALAQADKGKLEEASKSLGAIVGKSPNFKLAQKRYLEILRRLSEARTKRESSQSQNLQLAFKRVNFLLEDTDHKKLRFPLTWKYYSYRVARGQLMLQHLKAVTGPKNADGFRTVQKPQRKEAIDWMRAYLDNAYTLRDELMDVREKGRHAWPMPSLGQFFGKDKELLKDAGIAQPGRWWRGMTPSIIDCKGAEFILTGKPAPFDFFEDIKVTPALATLDPAMRQNAEDLLRRAIADTDKHNNSPKKKELLVATYDCVAGVLLETGRKAQAIARWQAILDRFPKLDDYDGYEKKIRDALEREDH